MLATLLLSASLSYALITPNDTTMHGQFSVSDVEMIRDVYGPRVFYFRSDGHPYVIFDAKVIAYVEDLFRPQRELGQRQAELGAKQAAFARKLSTLTQEWIRSGVAKPLQR
jgi:hypothetical protein